MLRSRNATARKTTSDLSPIFLRAGDAARLYALESRRHMHDLPKTSGWRREAPFRLGDLEVLPASGELRSPGGTQRVRPLLMDILVRLAAEPGEVVRRETLLEDVWPRRMVNDEVLSRAIAELRTALGDDARGARYIETLPKLGYRLVAPVHDLATVLDPPTPPVVAAANDAARPLPRHPWAKAAAALAVVAVVLGGAAAWLQRGRGASPAELEARLLAARPFTSDPALEVAPRFSPDGKHVAFSLVEGDESRVVVQDVDGSRRQFVGNLEGHARLGPVFFPDGRRIAYWKSDGKDCAIVRHDLDTGNEEKLLDCALQPRSRFDLSRDGRWLVFAAQPRSQFPASLWVLEIGANTSPVPLTATEPGRGEDVWPRFSPDARQVLFFRGTGANRVPYVVRRDDPASARAVTRMEGQAYGAAWLGESGPLLAAGDWLGFRALHAIDLGDGAVRLLGARGARFPDLGPNGEIAYESATYSSNVWMLDVASGRTEGPLWRSTRYTTQPEFSPDGRSIAFASNRDGIDAIYVAAPGGEPRRIVATEGMRYATPHWSRDGRYVYAARYVLRKPAGTTLDQVVRIPAGGGPAEQLAALGDRVDDVLVAEDGRVYFAERDGHAMRLSRAPLGDLSRIERLPLPVVSRYRIAGGRLVFTQPNLKTLTSCRLDTLACEPLPGLSIGDFDHDHWAVGPRSVFLRVVNAEGKLRLARYDLDSRRLTQSWDLAPNANGASIAISPDESRVAIVREEPPAIDLMIAR
jgi:Tol biopolymer transport system component/DNA-binding winged helix-turn-helix (wHTH) protein